jgi:hypothetical protein
VCVARWSAPNTSCREVRQRDRADRDFPVARVGVSTAEEVRDSETGAQSWLAELVKVGRSRSVGNSSQYDANGV